MRPGINTKISNLHQNAPMTMKSSNLLHIIELPKEFFQPISVILLTDGGPENKFDAIQNCQTEIDHKIALLNIHYSNSLVESHNKIIKYNYLYKMEIPDRNQLHKMMEFIVDDFNNRPHISLNGLTPNEVEANVQLDKIKRSNQLQCATEARKIYNNLNLCDHCRRVVMLKV